MAIFSDLKYNQYVPQYVGAPLDEYLHAANAVQDRYNQVNEGYSVINELADTLPTSPLKEDEELKSQLLGHVNKSIESAAQRGNFDEMQNEMRMLARQYSKQAAPLKENLSRYQAAEKSITSSELPKQHQAYLLSQLRSKQGVTYDEAGMPNYLQADPFAENVDLSKSYNDFINDYKSDKFSGPIKAVYDRNGLVEYYTNQNNERVDPNQVMNDLLGVAANDSKLRSFILQDAASNGVSIQTAEQFQEYAMPLMASYANKAGFDKSDVDWKLGEAGSFRSKQKEDEMTGGFSFDMMFGVPAKQGTATPSDLRSTRDGLTKQRTTINESYGRWLDATGVDPLTGISKDGKDYKDELNAWNAQLDAVDSQKWELDKIEQDAKIDAGLPANYTPSQKVLDQAQLAYDNAMNLQPRDAKTGIESRSESQKRSEAIAAYNKVVDNSNDPNLRAYQTALAKNAKDKTENRGITTFPKSVRSELDVIGNMVVANPTGFVKAKDAATGKELETLEGYGNAVQNVGWDVVNGKVELIYGTGGLDDKGNFVPSGKKVTITAPPEMEAQLIKKGILDPVDLEIQKQIGDNGGQVKIGNLRANVEIRRNAQNAPTETVVVLNNGRSRKAFPSKGDAIKFINNLAKIQNGN
jgi:hypothetical protein